MATFNDIKRSRENQRVEENRIWIINIENIQDILREVAKEILEIDVEVTYNPLVGQNYRLHIHTRGEGADRQEDYILISADLSQYRKITLSSTNPIYDGNPRVLSYLKEHEKTVELLNKTLKNLLTKITDEMVKNI